jgi:hypothetical protein
MTRRISKENQKPNEADSMRRCGSTARLGRPNADEREIELATLCDSRIRQMIEEERICLRSFSDVAPGRGM